MNRSLQAVDVVMVLVSVLAAILARPLLVSFVEAETPPSLTALSVAPIGAADER